MQRFSQCILLSVLLFGFLPAPTTLAQTEGVGLGASMGVSNEAGGRSQNPIGVNGKLWLSDRQALAGMSSFFIGADQQTKKGEPKNPSYWLVQGDLLFHNFNQLDVGEGYLALYIGAGSQFTLLENETQIALRTPVGINYMLGSSPIDIFAEVAPTLRVTNPESLRFDGAIGFRYFFDSGSSASEANGDGSSN